MPVPAADVQTGDSSTPENQDVNNQTVEPSVQSQTPEQQTQTPPAQGDDAVKRNVDEQGVPWENRAREYQRKFEEVNTKLDTVTQSLEQFTKSQQQREPSLEEWEAFAQRDDISEVDRNIANTEIKKLRDQSLDAKIAQALSERDKLQTLDTQKRTSVKYVNETYPDVFAKDANGQFKTDVNGHLMWNETSRLAQEVRAIMNREPELQNNPRGLSVAADIAYGQLARQGLIKASTVIQQQSEEISHLQKSSMIEGGGNSPAGPASPTRTAVDASISGKKSDTVSAVKAILKAKGEISD